VFIGTMLGLLFAGMYMAANLAVIGLLARKARQFNWFKTDHASLGVLRSVLMSVIGGLTIPILDVNCRRTATCCSTPPIVGGWMILGIVLYFVFGRGIRRRWSGWATMAGGAEREALS
jgi:hypothetical protein